MTAGDDGVPVLARSEAEALRAKLRLRGGEPLAEIQWAWLTRMPFHNIEVLARGDDGPRAADAALDRCLAGTGGPCHVHAVGFCALVRSMGFVAHLSGATIAAPDDHLVVIVREGGARFVCDVGNGHPYVKPFPMHEPLTQAHLGWRFESTPTEAGIILTRLAPEHKRTVYRTDGRERAFDDFEGAIRAHHTEPSFGPFLRGLRAVRITDDEMWTLRDLELVHYTATSAVRRVLDPHELVEALRQPLGLDDLPLEAAVAQWLERGSIDEGDHEPGKRSGARRAG